MNREVKFYCTLITVKVIHPATWLFVCYCKADTKSRRRTGKALPFMENKMNDIYSLYLAGQDNKNPHR